jgi:hypothetical protein
MRGVRTMASNTDDLAAGLDSQASFRVLESYERAAGEDTADTLRRRYTRALPQYPELAGQTVTIGRLDPDDEKAGRAWFYNFLNNYPVDEPPTLMVVYHELAHLAIHVRHERGEDVPITSEPFCSIVAVARMPPEHIYENGIAYLGRPSAPATEWPDICRRALEYREENHDYIKQCKEWLEI